MPNAWILQGSSDGVRWVTIDKRTGEIFPETGEDGDLSGTNHTIDASHIDHGLKYSKAFFISNPGNYKWYRMIFQGSSYGSICGCFEL